MDDARPPTRRSLPDPTAPDFEALRLYWDTQWSRISQLENQRLHVSNFIVAGTSVTLGLLVAADGLSAYQVAAVTLGVCAANLIAGWHSLKTASWIHAHHRRARLLLEENWAYLASVRDRVRRPPDRDPVTYFQIGLHLLQCVIALALATSAIA